MTGRIEEQELRQALHDPALALPDDLVDLAAVHATARTRQQRRVAVAAGSAVVVAAALGVLVAQPWQTAAPSIPDASGIVLPTTTPTPGLSTPAPGPTPTHSAPPVGAADRVVSVTAISAEHWWVLTSPHVPCPSSGCPTTLRTTTDGGRTFRQVSASGPGIGTIRAGTTDIRFLSPDLGWAVRREAPVGQQLWLTTDGGRTWGRQAVEHRILSLEAGGGAGWLLVQSGTKVGVAPLRPDSADNPGAVQWLGPNAGPEPALTAEGIHTFVLWSDENGSRGSQVSWTLPVVAVANPCGPDLGVDSMSASATGLAVSCRTGTADQAYVSTDDARTWEPLRSTAAAQRLVVGSVGLDLVAVGGQDGSISLQTPSGRARAADVGGNAQPWDYLGFTDFTHGFGITSGGELYRTTDGGKTWATVSAG